MSTTLHNLPARHGRRSKRVGRGHGSGRGTYAGRGIKGQRSRTGGRKGIIRRSLKHLIEKLPKQRGFTSIGQHYFVVNIVTLDRLFDAGATVTPAALAERGLSASDTKGVKILGVGPLTKALTVRAHAFSASAERAIKEAGGTAIRLKSVPADGE